MKFILLALLLLFYGFLISEKIDLTTADLGRHIKNGEIVLVNFNSGFLNTNFYSYTHPDFDFTNHHWLSGVFFYLILKISGFGGLSLFFITISLLTFAIFYKLAEKNSSTAIALICGVFLVPLIAERDEVRPEVFSYLFSAVFLYILWHFKKNKINAKWLIALPFLTIIWANSHIYFFLGLCLIGTFLLEEIISTKNKNKIKKLFLVLSGAIIASFLNPLGLKIVLYPLKIFENYGYKIIENQSIGFLENLGFIKNSNFLLFKLTIFLLFLSFLFVLIFKPKTFSISLFIFSLAFGTAAFMALRNFTIFGLFALPILSYNAKIIFETLKEKIKIEAEAKDGLLVFIFLLVLIFTFTNGYQKITAKKQNFGFGLSDKNNDSANFFIKNKINGPIFNNYDIGSYLIYNLYPAEKCFVDNRPEAYPVSFFENIYIPMQQDNKIWEEQLKNYNFNAILFAINDATPWGQNFLVERAKDPNWAPVYADQYAIIFLKQNERNKPIIEKYDISNRINIRGN